MNLICESNKSVFDLCLEINGTLENSLSVLTQYGITSYSQDLTGLNLNVSYNTNNQFVNTNYTNGIKIVTGDVNTYLTFKIGGAFDSGFSKGFDI